jgi:hypothetical protein
VEITIGNVFATAACMALIPATIDAFALTTVVGGAPGRGNLHGFEPEGVRPVEVPKGDIDAPVYGDNGRLTPTQTRFTNAGYATRQYLATDLHMSSNSGAVESRQWNAMKKSVQAQY